MGATKAPMPLKMRSEMESFHGTGAEPTDRSQLHPGLVPT